MRNIARKITIGFEIFAISMASFLALANFLHTPLCFFLIPYGTATVVFHTVFYFSGEKRVPIFLGPSFTIATVIVSIKNYPENIALVTGGIIIIIVTFIVTGIIIRKIGLYNVIKLFPPVIVGSIVINIGIGLAVSQIGIVNKIPSLTILITLGTIITVYAFIPPLKKYSLLIGIIIGILYYHMTNGTQPTVTPAGYFSLITLKMPAFTLKYTILFMMAAFAAVLEHIGDMYAISMAADDPFYINPGLHNSLISNGIAAITCFFMPFSGPITYSESIGAYILLNDYDPDYALYGGFWAIALGFLEIITGKPFSLPTPIVVALMFIAFGMIVVVGIRIFVENEVKLGDSRNFIITSMMLSIAIYNLAIPLFGINIRGIALSAITGIILNFILPGRGEK